MVNTDTGVFTAIGAPYGTADGFFGTVTLDNVTGISFHPLTGTVWAVHQMPGDDALFQVDPTTGAVIADAFGPGTDYVRVLTHGALEDLTDLSFDPVDFQLYGVLAEASPSTVAELVTIRQNNGNTRRLGSLTQRLEGLAFDAVGQLWGTDGAALWQVDETSGALSGAITHDNGSDYGAIAFQIPAAFPPALEGVVFEDGTANLVPAGEFVDGPLNRGRGGVTVSLYADDGAVPGEPDAADTLHSTTVTGPTGAYVFAGLPQDVYWVVVDSTTITPVLGGTGWAEQTYGPAGAATFDGATWSFAPSAGGLYGGKQLDVSDDPTGLTTAETRLPRWNLSLAGTFVENVDFGFSFEAITTARDGDDDVAPQRSVQGSLRQVLDNANAVTGVQTTRFFLDPAGFGVCRPGLLLEHPARFRPRRCDRHDAHPRNQPSRVCGDATRDTGWHSSGRRSRRPASGCERIVGHRLRRHELPWRRTHHRR